jgi:DNA modification methylase
MTAAAIDEHDVTVYLGDAAEVLAEQTAGSVQCIVTSPPYFGLRDYGVDGQLGLEASPAEYVAAMVAVFTESRRVLADDGVLWLNLGDSYASTGGRSGIGANATVGSTIRQDETRTRPVSALPSKNLLGVPWRVAFALQDAGWILRNAVIWNKPNAMPESVTDRLSTRYEHVFLFSKSRRYCFDLDPIREAPTNRKVQPSDFTKATEPWGSGTGLAIHTGTRLPHDGGRNPGDVWTISTSPFPGAHFACMPPELARRCILAGCPEDGTVYDPFTGSGTTAMVARSLGRRFVGSELNPDYIDIVRQRIGPTTLDFTGGTA